MNENSKRERFPHSSIVESSVVGKFTLNTEICPWVKVDVEITISRVTFDNGASVLIASHIADSLLKVGQNAQRRYESSIDQATYELARKIASNEFLDLARIKQPIKNGLRMYYYQGREVRVFVLHLGTTEQNIDRNLDLVIRIAVCQKNDEATVLKAISTSTKT